MTTQQFHNPQNLTPEEYGADQGWRLLTVNELQLEMPANSQYYDSGFWHIRINTGCGCSEFTYRTRAPIPVDGNEWVSIGERKPTLEDFPVVAHRHLLKDKIWFADEDFCAANCTHWKRYRERYPATAPKPMTREEEDDKACEKWLSEAGIVGLTDSWHAALAYERAKYRALIDRYNNNEFNAREFIRAVGEMCK